jgi:hypothetical protein
MPATWVDRTSRRGDAAKYKDLQYFILVWLFVRGVVLLSDFSEAPSIR